MVSHKSCATEKIEKPKAAPKKGEAFEVARSHLAVEGLLNGGVARRSRDLETVKRRFGNGAAKVKLFQTPLVWKAAAGDQNFVKSGLCCESWRLD